MRERMSERSKRRGRNASPVSNYRRMPSRFSPSMGASKRRESETKKRTSNVSYSPYSSQETSRSTKVSYSPPKSEGKIVIPSSNGGYYSTASPFAVPFEGTEDQHITVAVRARPMSEREKRLGALSVVKVKGPNIVGLTKLAQKSNPYLKSGLGSGKDLHNQQTPFLSASLLTQCVEIPKLEWGLQLNIPRN